MVVGVVQTFLSQLLSPLAQLTLVLFVREEVCALVKLRHLQICPGKIRPIHHRPDEINFEKICSYKFCLHEEALRKLCIGHRQIGKIRALIKLIDKALLFDELEYMGDVFACQGIFLELGEFPPS